LLFLSLSRSAVLNWWYEAPLRGYLTYTSYTVKTRSEGPKNVLTAFFYITFSVHGINVCINEKCSYLVDVENVQSYYVHSASVFMVCLIKHREKLTFTMLVMHSSNN
jgi:hypothetical protein